MVKKKPKHFGSGFKTTTGRFGLGRGKGKGYRNIQGRDPKIHSDSARGIKQPQRIINIHRVSYGSPKTPIELREYQMGFGQPVGTIKEFEDYFKDQNVKLNVAMTLKEKMEVTKKSNLKDSDGDGVGDVLDCQPDNPKKQDKNIREYGFDLTDFGATVNFLNMLDENNISPEFKKIKRKYGEGKDDFYFVYEWKNEDVTIHTGNNVITGEYSKPEQRANDKGYASYIGIKGKPEAVEKLKNSIKKYATMIKGEDEEAGFIW